MSYYDNLPVSEQKKIDDMQDATDDRWYEFNRTLDKLIGIVGTLPIGVKVQDVAGEVLESLRKLDPEQE
jgi:hypothetical protein